jgi:hypothetical protein
VLASLIALVPCDFFRNTCRGPGWTDDQRDDLLQPIMYASALRPAPILNQSLSEHASMLCPSAPNRAPPKLVFGKRSLNFQRFWNRWRSPGEPNPCFSP